MSDVFPPLNANGLFDDGPRFRPALVTLDELKNHLQTAMVLELKTIPLYLYAAYSIKVAGPVKWSIIKVVEQEMLHLALAGNVLCAIGGEPKLYSLPSTKFPSYPDKLFYQETPLNLRGATKGNIRTFMELERPNRLRNHAEEALVAYGSLGTFYWAIGEALKFQSMKIGDGTLFPASHREKQLQYGDGSWYNDEMVLVKDLTSALKAIDIIVDQGEGSQRIPITRATGSLDPPAPFGVKSHFEIFEDAYKGPPIDHYDVFENPKTQGFSDSHPEIYKVK